MGLGDAFDNTAPVAIALPTQNGGAFSNTAPVAESILALVHKGFGQLQVVQVSAVLTTNLTLPSSNPLTIDDVVISPGDKILLAGQTVPAENGIYLQGGSNVLGAATEQTNLTVGDFVFTVLGLANSGYWQCTNKIGSAFYFRKQSEKIAP